MNSFPQDASIEIVVSPTGAVRVQTRGFRGGTCRDASRALEVALGTRTAERLSGEFFEEVTPRNEVEERS